MRVHDVRWRAILGGCVAIAAGCGGGDGEPARAAAEAEAGEAPQPAASAPDTRAAADDFPIPAPEGGEVITDQWDGTTGHITLRYPAGRYEAIVRFYDGYADGTGWNRTEVGRGDVPTVNLMNLMDGLNIAIDPPSGDHLIVTLTVS